MARYKRASASKQQVLSSARIPDRNESASVLGQDETTKISVTHSDNSTTAEENEDVFDYSDEEDCNLPIPYEDFVTYTNVKDVAAETIKDMCMKRSTDIIKLFQYLRNERYIRKYTRAFHKIFYTRPDYRKDGFLGILCLSKNAPLKIRTKFYNIPPKYVHRVKYMDSIKQVECTESVEDIWNDDCKNPQPSTSNRTLSLFQKLPPPKPNKEHLLLPENLEKMCGKKATKGFPVKVESFDNSKDNIMNDFISATLHDDVCKCSKPAPLFVKQKSCDLPSTANSWKKEGMIKRNTRESRKRLRTIDKNRKIIKSNKLSKIEKNDIVESALEINSRNNPNDEIMDNTSNFDISSGDIAEHVNCSFINILKEVVPETAKDLLNNFPVTFTEFLANTNVRWLLEEKMNILSASNEDMQLSLDTLAYNWYVKFYTDPAFRQHKLMQFFYLRFNMANTLLQYPKGNEKANESLLNSENLSKEDMKYQIFRNIFLKPVEHLSAYEKAFPLSFEQFKRCILVKKSLNNILRALAKDDDQQLSKMEQDKELCEIILMNCYVQFYKNRIFAKKFSAYVKEHKKSLFFKNQQYCEPILDKNRSEIIPTISVDLPHDKEKPKEEEISTENEVFTRDWFNSFTN